jgi:hypothetical protein
MNEQLTRWLRQLRAALHVEDRGGQMAVVAQEIPEDLRHVLSQDWMIGGHDGAVRGG